MTHPCHKDQLSSIRRIEGQVKNIKKMIEKGDYCIDILNQIKAVKNSITTVEGKILKNTWKNVLKNLLQEIILRLKSKKLSKF